MKTPIEKAIDSVGGQAALARAIGVSRQAVFQWLATRKVPSEQIIAIEAATGIPREELRPDLYLAPRPRHRPLTNREAR